MKQIAVISILFLFLSVSAFSQKRYSYVVGAGLSGALVTGSWQKNHSFGIGGNASFDAMLLDFVSLGVDYRAHNFFAKNNFSDKFLSTFAIKVKFYTGEVGSTRIQYGIGFCMNSTSYDSRMGFVPEVGYIIPISPKLRFVTAVNYNLNDSYSYLNLNAGVVYVFQIKKQ